MKAGDKFGLVLVVVIVVALAVLCIVGPSKKQESVQAEAPPVKCAQFGRVMVDGVDRRLDFSVGANVDTPCIEFTAIVNGQGIYYVIVDTSDGWAPDGLLGFKLRTKEHNLNRHVLCVLNADRLLEVPFRVGLERTGASSAAALVNVGIYPVPENETCAGWYKTSGPARAAQ